MSKFLQYQIDKIYQILSESSQIGIVQITVPALIRICEIAREEIKGDTDLHEFIENILNKSGSKLIDSKMLEGINGDNDKDSK